MTQRCTVRLAALAVVLAAAGCSTGPRGASTTQVIGIVGQSSDQLVEQIQRDLSRGTAERPLVVFAGVDNDSGWEIGRNDQAAEEEIEVKLLGTGLVRLVDDRQVKEAMRAARIDRVSQLYLPAERERYLQQLGNMGVQARYLVWGVFTSVDDMSGRRERSQHRFSLDLVNVQTGEVLYKTTQAVR